jgi:hypothetical protein
MSSKYVQMALELDEEIDKIPLGGVLEWAKLPETKKKYMDLYLQFKKEKDNDIRIS